MTLLGKIFTVLIFIMSVLFMGFSVMVSATHKNWKMLVENREPSEKYPEKGLVPRLEQSIAANKNLRNDLERLRNQLAVEQAARRHAISNLGTKLASAQEALSTKEAQFRDLQSAEGVAVEALKLAQANVDALRAEVVKLRGDIVQSNDARDRQFERVVALTDQLHGAEGTEQNLIERNNGLIKDLVRYKKVMDRVGLTPDTPINNIAPDVNGIVTAVGESNLIEVSIGWDDGLREGHRLEVFRDRAYLGYAIIQRTDPDRSVAQMDEKSQRGLIKVQDRVATKISRTAAG